MKPYLILLLLLAAVSVEAQSLLPATELSPERFAGRSRKIEPGLLLYGVKWYSSPQEVIDAFGAPCGKIVYDRDTFALLFGQTHTLVFERNELREVIIINPQERHRGRLVAEHPFFDQPDFLIEPGFNLRSRGSELNQILAAQGFSSARIIAKSQSSFSFTTQTSAITFQLSFILGDVSEGKFKDVGIASVTIRGH